MPARTGTETEDVAAGFDGGEQYRQRADAELSETYEEPMSLAEYTDRVFDQPTIASHAAKYLLEAIEASGTRTVIEEGEEAERYRFFDDPYNDNEHAILGNTDVLNAFVDDLRSIASGRGKEESIIWFDGPTATGKSELKRCLINGVREYSKTPEGRRYTIEWNIAEGDGRSLSYGNEEPEREDGWYESPVQAHPLSVYPEKIRDKLLEELNATTDDEIMIRAEAELDPFSQEVYNILEKRYQQNGKTDRLFTSITDEDHLQVRNYVVDVGQGIGVLHPEDAGKVKERLVGSWMAGMLRELNAQGRKDPRAFSYDGVLSQGNGGLTIVEDASQHADLLPKLLNIPEERHVKLDKGIGMDIDTQLLIISNPDLEARLNQHAERDEEDPMKALKRRLDKREFTYLTNLSLETLLLHREYGDEAGIWAEDAYDDIDEKIQEAVYITGRDHEGARYERELAPHTLEAAAMYDVVSRLDDQDLDGSLDLVDKALLFDRGYIQDGDERLEKDDFDFDDNAMNGSSGIPVTYTRDILAALQQQPRDRDHQDLGVEDVVMPEDVLDAMVDGLADAAVFGEGERKEYERRVDVVEEYIFSRQEDDVLTAMLRDHRADTEAVEEYIEHVYAWETEDTVTTDHGEVDPDPLKMKMFEIESLGRKKDEYDGTDPEDTVKRYRREQLITPINRHAWENRADDFTITDVDLSNIPALQDVLATNDWDDVQRIFEDLDPRQWSDPAGGTETDQVKRETIQGLIDQGYSAASAELTSQHVMDEVIEEWD